MIHDSGNGKYHTSNTFRTYEHIKINLGQDRLQLILLMLLLEFGNDVKHIRSALPDIGREFFLCPETC